MLIRTIKITNFRSFDNLEINLEKVNCLIGANASGKSNFLYIFKFLNNIVDWGLKNAITMQGGLDFLLNFNVGYKSPFSFKILADLEWLIPRNISEKVFYLRFSNIEYSFSFEFNNQDEIQIKEDVLNLNITLFSTEPSKDFSKDQEGYIGEFELIISKNQDEIKDEVKILDLNEDNFKATVSIRRIQDIFVLNKNIFSPEGLLIESQNAVTLIGISLFTDILPYDFDLKFIKQSASFSGYSELEPDGGNLAIVLKDIIENEDDSRKLFNILNDILPYVRNIEIRKFFDGSLFLVGKEIYTKDKLIPATLLSDGTINILALIIALYFQNQTVVFFEEPEKSIHPYLISRIVDLFQDASKTKQIIFTTHNPLFLKYLELENLLFVQRNKNGFTEILKIKNIQKVKTFLENELGIEELFIDNLIEE